LQYVWDFGNGQRGGGKTITRSFATGGARTITLTVFDGTNRSGSVTHSITIAAPPPPASTLSVQASVLALDSTAILGVTIAQVGGTATTVTDTAGKARVTLGTASPLMLKFSKAGYADQFLPVTLPATTGTDGYVAVRMRARDAALTLSDAALGGSLTGRDGAVLTLPANALVNAAGTAVTGPVQISITPVDPTLPGGGGFPGGFNGLTQAGAATPLVSFGTTEYVLTAGSQSVQVAPGKSATIELPLYATKRLDGTILAIGDTTPLWSLDESTGAWVQEGKGTVVASATAPSGVALRATVTHFSWWNSDIGFDPYGPQPKCVYDTDIGLPGGNDTFATATICNMLAEMDQGAGAGPRLVSTKSRVAAATTPLLPGFALHKTVPIAGGVTFAVPANTNIKLSASALNGTWGGTASVNGPVGAQAAVLIKMRPLFAVAGPTPEAITLPFDGTRSLAALQPTALFTFTGNLPQYARVQLSPANGATLTGRLRLLQGTTVLGTTTITGTTAQIIAALPANATYTVEIVGDVAGAFRLQVDALGSLQTEPITLPVDITKSLAAYVTYNGTLIVTAPTTIYLARSVLTGGGQADVRMLSSNGSVLLDGTGLPDAARGATLTLPAAGTYTLEMRPRTPGSTTNVRATIGQTVWAQVGPALDTIGILSLVDAIADRNGKVVVGYTKPTTLNGHAASRLKLQRWTGVTWESVATDLIIDQPCYYAGSTVSFAFDHANRPVVLSGSNPGTGTFITASRYAAGAWQALGPNGGTLPRTSATTAACNPAPSVAFGGDDAPLAAYQADNNVVVQRFDGTEWKGLVQADIGDTFPLGDGSFDLKVDASDRVWLVTGSPSGSGTPAVARRFNSATLAWDAVGGNLPQSGISGLATPRLRFDPSGQPVIGWIAQVGASGSSTAGTAVDRFDGAAWSSAGGFVAIGGRLVNNSLTELGFALFNGDAWASWTNSKSNDVNGQQVFGIVAQRNTAAGWAAVGTGIGEIPQFTAGGINDVQSASSRLVAIGGEVYLVLISYQGSGVSGAHIVLLHKVAN
jgi:hypothetical protein